MYNIILDVFLVSSFLEPLIFLNSPLSSASLCHIWPSLSLASSAFIFCFFSFDSSDRLRRMAVHFSAFCLISVSSASVNSLKLMGFCSDSQTSFFFRWCS